VTPTKAEEQLPASVGTEVVPVQLVHAFHMEKAKGGKNRKQVLIISVPVCEKTRDGLRDTVESLLYTLPCVGSAMLMSNTTVAVMPKDKFDDEQADAVVRQVAKYRYLEPSQYEIQKLSSSSPVARRLVKKFRAEVSARKSRVGAGASSLQAATRGGG
jgi:hypothetical protein